MVLPVIAIHGGCGVMAEIDLSEREWQEARADLATALRQAWVILQDGGSALDAVQRAVQVMEDSAHFNAGHGATLNTAGEHELDASIMDGHSLGFGAVCAARRIRNPIAAARALLESGELGMLAGVAADHYAETQGLEMVAPDYFTTERRRQALHAMQAHQRQGTTASEAEKHGTVGAVALDSHGHLAAATSTGGYTNKPEGRVGDSPVIGAGTYACNGVCAISGTGKGEFFIRHVAGHEIASRMRYLGESLEQAAAKLVFTDLAPYRIGAGVIGVDASGAITAPYNTDGMFRGWITQTGELSVATHAQIYRLGKC